MRVFYIFSARDRKTLMTYPRAKLTFVEEINVPRLQTRERNWRELRKSMKRTL